MSCHKMNSCTRYSCPGGAAAFRDGHTEPDWKLVLKCSSADLNWQRADYSRMDNSPKPEGGISSEGIMPSHDDPMLEEPKTKQLRRAFDELSYQWPICGELILID